MGNTVITHLGFLVGLLSCLTVLLAAILALLSAMARHLTGWHEKGFKRLFSHGLIDIIHDLDDGDARWLACYLRECIVDDEIPAGEGARRYITKARETPDEALRGAIRHDAWCGFIPAASEERRHGRV